MFYVQFARRGILTSKQVQTARKELLVFSLLVTLIGGFLSPVKAEKSSIQENSFSTTFPAEVYNILSQEPVRTVQITIVPSQWVEPPTPAPKAVSKGSKSLNYTVNDSVIVIGSSPAARDCVTYLRSIGVYIPTGYVYARYLPVTTRAPFVGAVMVSYDSWRGHVSLVKSINSDGTITVQDGNWDYGLITQRVVKINSNIKGFF